MIISSFVEIAHSWKYLIFGFAFTFSKINNNKMMSTCYYNGHFTSLPPGTDIRRSAWAYQSEVDHSHYPNAAFGAPMVISNHHGGFLATNQAHSYNSQATASTRSTLRWEGWDEEGPYDHLMASPPSAYSRITTELDDAFNVTKHESESGDDETAATTPLLEDEARDTDEEEEDNTWDDWGKVSYDRNGYLTRMAPTVFEANSKEAEDRDIQTVSTALRLEKQLDENHGDIQEEDSVSVSSVLSALNPNAKPFVVKFSTTTTTTTATKLDNHSTKEEKPKPPPSFDDWLSLAAEAAMASPHPSSDGCSPSIWGNPVPEDSLAWQW